MSGFWDNVDEGRGARRPSRRRVDLRGELLRLLAEEPRNGAQLTDELERRSDGRWHPRPESVYAMLQMLQDEGLVTVVESDGKRLYDLTESGRVEAEGLTGGGEAAGSGGGEGSASDDLLRSIAEAARVFVGAAATADRDQRVKLVAALRRFREAVLEAVPDAERGPFPPRDWGFRPGWTPPHEGRPWVPDIARLLGSFGAGTWPSRAGGRRGWAPSDPIDEDDEDDETW